MRTDMNAFRCIHQTALRARIVPRKRFGRLLVYGDGDVERQLFGEVRMAKSFIHLFATISDEAVE